MPINVTWPAWLYRLAHETTPESTRTIPLLRIADKPAKWSLDAGALVCTEHDG